MPVADQYRVKVVEALNSAYIDPGDQYADLRATERHDGHQFSAACYVCRGDVDKLADRIMSQVVVPLLSTQRGDWARERIPFSGQLQSEVSRLLRALSLQDGLREALADQIALRMMVLVAPLVAALETEVDDWRDIALGLAQAGDGTYRRLTTRQRDKLEAALDGERDRAHTAASAPADAASGGEQ